MTRRSGRHRSDPTKHAVDLIIARDGDVCPAQMHSPCAGIMTTQHRIGRGMGGSRIEGINRPQNLIRMCAHHNELIEKDADFRAVAVGSGWSIPRNWAPAIDPLNVPVRYWDGPHMIDEAGNRTPVSEADAVAAWSKFHTGWSVA